MNWIRGKPEREGYYWVWMYQHAQLAHVYATWQGHTLDTMGGSYPLESAPVRYYIPIEKPEPPEDA